MTQPTQPTQPTNERQNPCASCGEDDTVLLSPHQLAFRRIGGDDAR